jgi:FKBP-type peptidyl-prolyl cis-trans isomerase
MKIGLTLLLATGLGVAGLQSASAAEDKPALKDQKEKVSYSIGMNIGANLKRSGYDIDIDVLANGIKDSIAGGPSKLTEAEAREVLTSYQKELGAKREEERKKTAEKNRKEGEAFLAENKKKPGIKTHEVKLPDGTSTELQYKVITEGTGAIPKSNDTVSVNFTGKLINGKEYDSSAKHGAQPAKFPVSRIPRGWSEALQMMKTGSKWELYLPANLAYGDFGTPNVEPGSAVIIEVELVGVDTPQPLTSDIIRVPSAEELKAGAKVEVIKAEDVEKAKAEAQKAGKSAEKKP